MKPLPVFVKSIYELAGRACISFLKKNFEHYDWMKILAASLRVDSSNKWKIAFRLLKWQDTLIIKISLYHNNKPLKLNRVPSSTKAVYNLPLHDDPRLFAVINSCFGHQFNSIPKYPFKRTPNPDS